ncbi:hypothetical protein A0H81_14539 [Grifola frondosa]|nr:hypothetical protein A0H81_14539 [Grifola frondosa]
MLFKPLFALVSVAAVTFAAPQAATSPPVSTFTATRILQSFQTVSPFVTTLTSEVTWTVTMTTASAFTSATAA